jgi:chromosome segregation ATPase
MNDIEILKDITVTEFNTSNIYLNVEKVNEAIKNVLNENNSWKKYVEELEEQITELNNKNCELELQIQQNMMQKTLIEEEINRLKYDVSKIKEIKQTRYSDYDRIRLSAYVTKSNEIIKRLKKCVKKR